MTGIWGLAAIATKFLLYLGVLTAAGSVIATLMFRVAPLRGLTISFAVLGLLAAVFGFALGGAALTGDASGMIDPEMLGLLWSTPVGTALVLRCGGLGLLIIGMMIGGNGLWLAGIGAGLALWSFATVGHIPDFEMLWLNIALLIHLAGASAWIGILIPLRRLANAGHLSDAADLGHRFGRIAMVFVPLVILAGLVMSYLTVGSITALAGTGYGQALLIKIVVVAVLLSFAALNKQRFVPRLIAGDPQAALQLSRSIGAEWGAVVIILLTTAVLTSVLTLP